MFWQGSILKALCSGQVLCWNFLFSWWRLCMDYRVGWQGLGRLIVIQQAICWIHFFCKHKFCRNFLSWKLVAWTCTIKRVVGFIQWIPCFVFFFRQVDFFIQITEAHFILNKPVNYYGSKKTWVTRNVFNFFDGVHCYFVQFVPIQDALQPVFIFSGESGHKDWTES